MTTLNLVVPRYNEEVLPETGTRLLAPAERLTDVGEVSDKGRITFVNDGSRDRTWLIVDALHAKNARYGGVKRSRNRTPSEYSQDRAVAGECLCQQRLRCCAGESSGSMVAL
ncbi:hypothetical protein CIC12_27915 [Burkholderia sp. SG-MS1]|uniref:glycosyltransferase n=1 Tax=Paraburkholderia sp. SG-MS1 TaxID=2023741 RepID=UPI00144603DE|nr:glycosyltransferase [Paraburkholderia sp. SG-MS1]NKJ50482.1 hypothetical protein [Paraburkholderia sp. SG-MS1]